VRTEPRFLLSGELVFAAHLQRSLISGAGMDALEKALHPFAQRDATPRRCSFQGETHLIMGSRKLCAREPLRFTQLVVPLADVRRELGIDECLLDASRNHPDEGTQQCG
jgi:hypothetical protein